MKIELTKRETAALSECAIYRQGTYSWRVASMRKLEEKGLVDKVERIDGYGGCAWILNAAGESVLLANGKAA